MRLNMAYIPQKLLEQKLLQYLQEDIDFGDVTCDFILNVPIQAEVIAKQQGFLCGIHFAKILLESLGIEIINSLQDGDPIKEGECVLQIKGKSHEILLSERTVLNLIMHLSGISTHTRRIIDKVRNSKQKITIAATRKTTPGLRYFEKYAVKIVGGDPHRWNLSDMILIKENHLRLFGDKAIQTILQQSKKDSSFTKKVEIEVEDLTELKEALMFSPEIIMLDDFSIEMIKKAVNLVQQTPREKRPLIEISGGVTEDNIDDYLAISGIDIISIGALTHTVTALDLSMRITKIFK